MREEVRRGEEESWRCERGVTYAALNFFMHNKYGMHSSAAILYTPSYINLRINKYEKEFVMHNVCIHYKINTEFKADFIMYSD